MSKLSLTTRKNIQEAEAKRTTHLKTITAASGIGFDIEVDWLSMAAVCEERGYKDRAGDLIFDTYLEALASNIKSFCTDPIQKEAFIETFKDRHALTFVIEPEQDEESPNRYAYAWTSNNGGVLEVHIPKTRFCSNVSSAGEDFSKTCSGDSPLTVATRKNIADAQKKLATNLKTIKTATGIEFEVEIDWVVMAEICKERGYENRAGEMLYDSYLSALASNINRFSEDAIQKEAFIETFKERHALTFVLEPEQDEDSPHRSDYAWTTNNGGVLVIHLPKTRFCTNVSCAGDDLTKTCSGDSPLTVATRKNIADAQKKLATNLKTIKTATGIDFELEIDWVAMAEVCKERGYEGRAGDIMYDTYLEAIASNIKSFCTDPIQKEAFLETFKERHALTFVIEPEQDEESPNRYAYSWTSNKGGVLVIHIPRTRFCSNVSCAGEDFSKTCSGDSPLTVATRKNIADYQKKLATNLKTIKTATGIEFEVEIDWVVMAEICKERGYENRAGEMLYDSYLSALASNINRFSEDAIQKEAFIETFKDRHALTFVLEGEQDEDSPHRSDYAWTTNKEGVLVIHLPKTRFCTNVSCAGDDLTKTCSGDSPLTVATRKNIADAQKKLAANLKTIKTATGIDFELEIDWVVMAEVCKERGYEGRAGDIMYDTYLEAIASNIKSFCTDPIQKEAFLETFKERHALTFVIEPEQDEESPNRYAYSWTSNKGGVLVIHIPRTRFCSNVSSAGEDFTKTCSGDSPLSVATRKNIADQEKLRVKNIGRINKAVGFEFETEIDWVSFAAGAKARGYEDRVGEILYDWYFAALASSLERLCADSMSKEAVQESCEKKVIAFTLYDGATSDLLNSSCYSQCTFEDGVLKVLIPKDRLCSNVGETGSDIESRL